jgi:hypothetical protein
MSTNLNPLEKVHLWGDTRLARSEAVTEAEVRAVWFEKSEITF